MGGWEDRRKGEREHARAREQRATKNVETSKETGKRSGGGW